MPHCWKSHVAAQIKILMVSNRNFLSRVPAPLKWLAGLFYFLILRATTIYWNTFVTFHKVFCARCGTNCIDSWYLPSSLLFILTRIPTHKKYRTLCFPTLSNPAVDETVLTPVKWCCNTGEVPIRIKKKTMGNRHLVRNYYFLWFYINVCNKSISAFDGELTYLYNCIWMVSYFWLISSNIQSQVGKKV